MVKKALVNIWKSAFFKAFLLSTVAFICALLFSDIKYEISDDFIVDAVLSGAFGGEYNPHLLFSNIILGYILVFFYRIIGGISFYFVYLMLLGYFSMIAVTYVCFNMNNERIGWMLSVLTTVFFSADLYVLPSFTKTASVAIIAGGFLLMHVLWDCKFSKKVKVIIAVLSFVLMLAGSLLRFSCVYLTAVFVAAMFLGKVLTNGKIGKAWKTIFKNAVVCIICLLTLFLFEYIGDEITKQYPEYQMYHEYNAARSAVTDSMNYDWDKVSDDYAELDLSLVDYYMIGDWSFVDSGIYTKELLQEVGALKKSLSNQFGDGFASPIDRVAAGFVSFPFFKDWTFWACVLLFVTALYFDRNKLSALLLFVLITIGMFSIFFYMWRFPYRITYGVFFGLYSCILSCISVHKTTKEINLASIGLSIVAVAMFLPVYFPDRAYAIMGYEQYQWFANSVFLNSYEQDYRKYRLSINDAGMFHNLIELVESDDEHYYLFQFSTTIQSTYYYYKPWERLPLNYFRDNYMYLGGVTMQYPDDKKCLEYNGIDPDFEFGSIVDSNILIVSNLPPEIYQSYLLKYYSVETEPVLVGDVDGMWIWKYISVSSE